MSAIAHAPFPPRQSIDLDLDELDELDPADALLSTTSLVIEVEPDELAGSNAFLDAQSAGARDAFADQPVDDADWLDAMLVESADRVVEIDAETFVEVPWERAVPDQSGEYPIQFGGPGGNSPGKPLRGRASHPRADDDLDPPTMPIEDLLEATGEPEPPAVEPMRLPQFSLLDAARGACAARPPHAAGPVRLPCFSVAEPPASRTRVPPVRLARFELPERDLTWWEVMGWRSRAAGRR